MTETDAERMERERMEALARVLSDGADLPFEVKVCALCRKLRPIPKGRENCTTCRHLLTRGDLQRMNVPEEFWKVSFAGLTESVRTPVANFLRMFDECFRAGTGLYLWGPPGRGKTSTAVVLLKAARERFKTGYFIRASELREALRSRSDFDADMTISERVREVDFLVIDSFGLSDVATPWFKLEDLADLVTARGQRGKVTILTTLLSPVELAEVSKADFFAETGTYLVQTKLEGENRRADRQRQLARAIHGMGTDDDGVDAAKAAKPKDKRTKGSK